MNQVPEALLLGGWIVLWSLGGWLLTEGVFRLRRGEAQVVGLGVGLVLQVWLANALAQIVAAPLAFWLAPALLAIIGALAAVRQGVLRLPAFRPALWALLGALTLLFFAIGRGLAIFDDYQNLPTLSLMAAGDVPPHFALDPALRFGYHHFLLLFAAEFMVIGKLLPWTALDLARGLVLALPLVLGGMWVHRLSGSRVLAWLGGGVLAFAGGSRWLLLLLPAEWLNRLSAEITLIGSAASSAPTLAAAMVSNWKIDGGGPIPFPFAFYSGVNQPHVMLHTGIAGSGILILLMLLLTAERWRNRGAAFVTAGMMAALAIANEIAFLLLGLGLLIVGLAWILARNRRMNEARLLSWMGIGAAALVAALLQGGLITELTRAGLTQNAAATSYFDATPSFAWPPTIVSAHAGALSLINPAQATLALLEIGPIILISPLVFAWGRRAFKRGRWFEAALIASSLGALLAALIAFKGPLFTAAPRLLGGWLLVSALYFVPLLRAWSARRPDWIRVSGLVVGLLSCLGGIVLFSVQLAAIQRPVYATFISALDAKATEDHWNELESDALVFDPLVYRAPTVLGRPTWSSPTWYSRYERWEELRASVDPREMRLAGYDYVYLDGQFWEQLSAPQQAGLQDVCVKSVWQLDGIRGEDDYRKDFRRLLDIRTCQ